MKAEAWIFGATTIFVAAVAPLYWFMSNDWTGTTALVMTALLTGMVTAYLGYHAKQMDEVRPEDRSEAEIADGAGELGFFPPYSWWPLWCALSLAAAVFAIAMAAWWLFIIASGLGFVALSGLVFEYYRGEYAH